MNIPTLCSTNPKPLGDSDDPWELAIPRIQQRTYNFGVISGVHTQSTEAASIEDEGNSGRTVYDVDHKDAASSRKLQDTDAATVHHRFF